MSTASAFPKESGGWIFLVRLEEKESLVTKRRSQPLLDPHHNPLSTDGQSCKRTAPLTNPFSILRLPPVKLCLHSHKRTRTLQSEIWIFCYMRSLVSGHFMHNN